LVKDCLFTLAALEKTLPTSREEFDEFKVVRSAALRSTVEPSTCAFGQALELSGAEGPMTRHMEVKNEQFGEIDAVRPM